MSKRLEIMVRLSSGGQLFWDAQLPVDVENEALEALTPHRPNIPAPDFAERKRHHQESREKFLEAAGRLWDRVMTKVA